MVATIEHDEHIKRSAQEAMEYYDENISKLLDDKDSKNTKNAWKGNPLTLSSICIILHIILSLIQHLLIKYHALLPDPSRSQVSILQHRTHFTEINE